MSNQPRFLPPEGMSEKHLANTEGHSCVIYAISPEDEKPGTVVPDRFRKLAIGEGCGVVGLNLSGSTDEPANRTDLIVAAIAAVMDRQDSEELGGDGRPKLASVVKQAGFKVTKTQFDAAWPLYVDGLGADDEGQDD